MSSEKQPPVTPLRDFSAERVTEFEKRLSAERGDFYLFALVIRPKTENLIDIVVSAPWLRGGSSEDLQYLSARLKESFTAEELVKFSAIYVLDKNHPFVLALNDTTRIEHAVGITFENCMFNKIKVKGTLVVTSNKNANIKE